MICRKISMQEFCKCYNMLAFYHSFKIKRTLYLARSFRNHDLESELVSLHEGGTKKA